MNFTAGYDTGASAAPTEDALPLSIDEQVRNQIANMPDGPEKQAVIARLLRSYADEGALAGEVLGRGYDMADTPAAQGTRTGGRYGTYVAASPLEHLATGLRQYQGFRDIRSAKEKLEELAKEQQRAREHAFTSTLGGGTAPSSRGYGSRYGITGRGF